MIIRVNIIRVIKFLSLSLKAIPFFFRLLSNAFSDFGSVGRKRKKKKQKKKKMEKESYPWSLESTRRGYKVNMAAMEEGKIDIVVKLKREQRKK